MTATTYLRLALLGFTLLVASCKKAPRAGDACEPLKLGMVGCESESTALYCVDMTVRAIPCRGPKGCAPGLCDTQRAREGEPCFANGFGAPSSPACGDDRVLVCEGGPIGKWVTERMCRGPSKCTPKAMLDCDESVGEVGDVCTGHMSCSVDGKRVLTCEHVAGAVEKKLVLTADCAGAKGCVARVSDGVTFASCDYSQAAVGGACGKGNEDLRVCAADGSAVLQCDGDTWKFVAEVACKTGERCRKDPWPSCKP